MVKTPVLSEQELDAVRQAVVEAERQTCAEIVPMIVDASARYREIRHLAGLLTLFATLTVMLVLQDRLTGLRWGGLEAGWQLLALAVAYLVGASIGSLGWVIRFLAAKERLERKVRLRAEHAFYRHGLHRTQTGTGLLLFVSLLEREVLILVDRAIAARVGPETWSRIADELADGLGRGRPAEGLCTAIQRCGAILAEHFPHEGVRQNQLPDDLVREP